MINNAYIIKMIAKVTNNMMNRKVLFLIFFLAICLRIFYLIYYNSLPDWNQLTVDNYYHYNWAVNFANGNFFGDTTYFRAPFYIYCLGILYLIFGVSIWIGRIFGFLVGLCSILMTYLIGKKAFDYKTGLLAAFIHAVYPVSLYFEAELLLDPLFMLLLQLTIYRLLIWIENKTPGNAGLTGFFMGIAALTRPTILVWTALLLLLIIIYRKDITQWYKQVLFFVLALFIVISPVTIRNLIIADDPVLIASQGGINFYIGNNPDADGVSAVMPEPMGHNWQISQISHIAEKETGRVLKSGEISSFWLSNAVEWIVENPGDFIGLYLKKLYFNILNREISNNRDLNQFFQTIPILKYNPVSFGILLAFTVAAILLLWRDNKTLRLLTLLLIIYILAGSLFFFNSRFRLPMLPFYFIFSAAGLIMSYNYIKNKSSKRVILIAILSLTLFISYYPVVSLSKSNSPQTLMAKGNYYFAQGDYENSLRYNREAYKVDSLFPEVNLNIGTCFLKSGTIDSAQFYFQQETEIHPFRDKAYTNLASLKYLDHKYPESIELAYTAIKYNPYDVTAHQIILRATFADESLDNETCYLIASESSDITNNDIYFLNEAGVLLTNRGMLTNAEEFLSKALLASSPPIEINDEAFRSNFKNSPDNMIKQRAFSNFQLGYVKGLQESYGESIRYSIEAINLDPTLTDAYVNLVSGYLATNQRTKADSILSHSLQLFPSYAPLLRLNEILYNQ